MQPRLRLFTGEDESCDIDSLKVKISFGELSTILLEACRKQRAFLRDFEDDELPSHGDQGGFEHRGKYVLMRHVCDRDPEELDEDEDLKDGRDESQEVRGKHDVHTHNDVEQLNPERDHR